MDDIWIEVAQARGDMAPFIRGVVKPMPNHGASIAEMRAEFNLTAYVKHMIEQAKSA